MDMASAKFERTSKRIGASAIFPRLAPALAVILLATLLIALNPVVFVGGGNDDFHYLQAARCFAENGFCVAPDHWWSRLPLVAPLGASIALFGASRASLAIVPFAYSLAAILLFVAMMQRQFGRVPATIAGLALVATPVIADDLVRLAVDLAELAWLLAALFCLQSRARGGDFRWLVLAGMCAALAVETRATSLVALPVFAAALLLMKSRTRDLAAFACGFAAPMAAQSIADLAFTGNALHHWQLQLGHTALPSTQLPQAAANSGSPILNLAIIRAWPPAAGIDSHWSVRALVNLFASPEAGLTLCAAALVAIASLRELSWRSPGGRTLILAICGGALWFVSLVFLLAIDPRPRMFEPVVAVAAAVIGVLVAQRIRNADFLLPIVLGSLILGYGLFHAMSAVPIAPAAAATAHELRKDPAAMVDARSAKFLALDAGGNIRIFAGGQSGRLLILAPGPCPSTPSARLGNWALQRQQRFERPQPAVLRWMRDTGLLRPLEAPGLCEYVPKRD